MTATHRLSFTVTGSSREEIDRKVGERLRAYGGSPWHVVISVHPAEEIQDAAGADLVLMWEADVTAAVDPPKVRLG